MNKHTKDLIKKYGLSEDDLKDVTAQLLGAFLILMQASEEFENNNNTLLYNSCGELGAPDGTHYQIQLMIVSEKDKWITSDGVYYSTPIEENPNIN